VQVQRAAGSARAWFSLNLCENSGLEPRASPRDAHDRD